MDGRSTTAGSALPTGLLGRSWVQPVVAEAKLLTVIEARVPKERWDDLKRKYEELRGANPPERVGGYLAQSAEDPEIWHGISIWESAAALEAYRARIPVPAGFAVFKALASDVKLRRYSISAED
jgi:hypothetical protein